MLSELSLRDNEIERQMNADELGSDRQSTIASVDEWNDKTCHNSTAVGVYVLDNFKEETYAYVCCDLVVGSLCW